MISHELKLLEIEHNANRISNHEFAHRAFLIISDELAKMEKHRTTNESEHINVEFHDTPIAEQFRESQRIWDKNKT